MTNFATIKQGSIRIKHYSTSSTIEIIVGRDEDLEHIMLDYSEFEDLREALSNSLLDE